ncbi:MAG: hypothetical protein U1E76_10165 [Planctomycetota bacterium]
MKLPLKKILLAGLLGYAVVLGISYFYLPALLLNPAREPFDAARVPVEIAGRAQDVEIPDGKDFMLRGTLVTGKAGLPLVVLIPDSNHSRLSVMDRAVALMQADHPLLALDPRGQGRSDGNYGTFGFREADDVRAAIDHLAKLGIVGGEGVILYGVGAGASVATIEASGDARVAALVLESPFANLREALIHRICLAGVLPSFLAALPVDLLLASTADLVPGFDASLIDVEAHAASLQIPVLLIHGNLHETVPASHFDRVYRVLQHPASQRLVIPGESGVMEQRAATDLFRSGLAAFLERVSGNP